MASLLDFSATNGFRKKLLTRNLTPYAKAPNRPTLPIDTTYVQTDSSVQDSPDKLIDEPSFANKLYPLNEWGSEGGYKQVPDPTGLLNTKSNKGEYGPGQQDAKIIDQSQVASNKGFGSISPAWKPLNAYANGTQTSLDSGEYITQPDFVVGGTRLYNNQPYPTTFNPSSYGPVGILLSRDPLGSNGLLSQDSFIAKLGAQTLRKSFEERIAQQIYQNTAARANLFSVDSGIDVVNLVTGRVPLIEPNWTITVPSNPILAATDFALRLAGSIIPVSPIPGSYWDTSINSGQPTTIQQLQNAFRRSTVGNFFNRLLGAPQTGSQLFLNNTGGGQRSILFRNINFNKYKPSYDRGFLNRGGGALVGGVSNNSNYYVGSRSSEPSQVFSPPGALPVNDFGVVQQSPVFGPTELAQLYEGPSKEIKLGANGPTYGNGGGIEGGFTWVSPKYKGNAGKRVGLGGEITSEDEDFKPSSYNSTESTERTFREGSILDDTQRLINSQPQGGKRLQHVGNAIDQVSKVFNDGYKEMTKGSRVYRYVGDPGQEVGTEYCRVFAKDTPYLQYNDLQKADGITTQGRRFSDSVLDNTYNLNIVPNKQEGGQSSTNLIGTENNAFAKKYMFSLENLAWRTSSSPGYSVSDLPICERGPNGGRVMWFPPYGLTFSESVSANWNSSDFLGRPEPIYTYKSTQRGGTLSWKIVVDHPSVLNVIVNKVLSNETNATRVNSILDSFFAGCRKYDLYELAKRYWKVNPNDLYQLQEAITSKKLSREQIEWSKSTIQTGVDGGQGQPLAQGTSTTVSLKDYEQIGLYFGNDYPKQGSVTNYSNEFSRYTSTSNIDYYKSKSPSTAAQTTSFFDNVVKPNYKIAQKMVTDLATKLSGSTGTITITIDSSCSAPATVQYNQELSKRRVESAVLFFSQQDALKKFIEEKRLLIVPSKGLGESTRTQPKQFKVADPTDPKDFTLGNTVRCTDEDKTVPVVGGDVQVEAKEIFTYGAMACRRAYISSIKDDTSTNVPSSTPTPKYTDVFQANTVTTTVDTEETVREWKPRDNITKRVLRSLLSECDYFETIKQDSPMVYDNLRDKLKFFQPAFHSITPEGLNSRLTFLQQCMRPGDTIPTIKTVNGTESLQYNNAVNTAFGAPPVLVLRIGDFYNTKIIPDSLNISYEDLDINPEGIGVQPMIATIQLGFKFVGGSGLKESVDKLQNALSFNYYANTEIYDDRADVTAQEDFLKVLDAEFLAMANPPAPPAVNQAEPNNGQNNNQTIGTIISKEIVSTFETGKISYQNYMVNLVNQTQTYFQNVVNKQKEVNAQYNNAMRQQWMLERNYAEGVTPVNSTSKFVLFGKPNNVEKRVNNIFAEYEKNISVGNDEFIKYVSDVNWDFSQRLKETVKTNYANFVKNKRGNYQNAITKIIQDITNIETQYIQQLSRANILTFEGMANNGTDGFQSSNGNVTLYRTIGTNEFDPSSQPVPADTFVELRNDYKKIQDDVITFNNVIWKNHSFVNTQDGKEYTGVLVFNLGGGKALNSYLGEKPEEIVFKPFSKNRLFETNFTFRRQYMIVSDDILDDKKYQTFKQAIIGNIIGNQAIIGDKKTNIEEVFDAYWLTKAKPLFTEENNLTKSFIDNLEKNDLKNFIKYTPFPSKKRVLSFTSEKPADTEGEIKSQEAMVKNLAAQTNSNTDQLTWNIKNDGGAYISKAKLN
jgi:hypothetical protein